MGQGRTVSHEVAPLLTVPEDDLPDTLEAMQPLFAAVAHGCAAGLHQEALDAVYWLRILRGKEAYINHKLGAFASDLAVVAHFFRRPWDTPAAGLTDFWKGGVLNWAAFDLRALGRLAEAEAPMRAGMELRAAQKDWKDAAIAASNLAELHLTLGAVAAARAVAAQGVGFADNSEDDFQRLARRTTLAEAQHHGGAWAEAAAGLAEAEGIQQQFQPEFPRLYSVQGFRYGEYWLSLGDWRQARERAEMSLKVVKNLLSIALDQLTLGRASLQQACLAQVD